MSVLRRSGLYVGTIRHRRLSPKPNAFQYGLYQLLIDLDELPELDRELRLLSHNRPNVTAFYDTDHMGRPAAPVPVREKLSRWLARRGKRLGDGPVLLLTNPRVLGYVFNPVSYFFCLDTNGDLRFVVAEVNNTFGETYCYLLDDGEPMGGRAVRSRRDKVFHVSPFISMVDISYDWILTPPEDHLTVHIDEFERGEKFFDATLNLERRSLTDRSLANVLLRHPHLTARTVYLIHRQALRLWLKRVPVFRKPEPPANDLEAA
jgi:DUF1365 family protein